VTVEQQVRFSDALAQLPSATRDRVMVHAANSCATRHWPNTHFDAVRCGGALFGLDLAAAGNEAEQPAHALDPVMSVVAPVVQVRSIEAGQRVGYGGTWQAQSDATLAVVPLGYADGYPSHRSTDSACSKTVLPDPPHLLIAGHRCPLVGRVSMDRITVDVSRIAGRIQEGDEAVVLGEQAGHRITASQLARWSDSSLYEVTTRFSRRLPLEIRASPES
jgi:alanine racemase